MTYLPVKARSALVWPRNSRGGGVCDSTLRFQVASPASNNPAFSPTRGSGFGGVADMLPVVEVEWAQPTAAATPRASVRDRTEARLIQTPLASGEFEGRGATAIARSAWRPLGYADQWSAVLVEARSRTAPPATRTFPASPEPPASPSSS